MNQTLRARWCHTRARAVAAVIATLVSPLAMQAQTTTATLRGYVRSAKDSSKTIPGAIVTAVNNASGYTHRAAAKGDGSFFLSLDPAVYTVTVAAPGFGKSTKTTRVQVGQALDLNFDLAPESEGSTVVEVVGTLVEMQSAEVATNVTTEQIENLPQGRRSFLDFAALAPGVRISNDPTQNQTFSSGGQSDQKVNVFIDGLSYKNDVIQGGVMGQDSSKGNPFPIGAVQEFRVMTENFKAEYQKASAAIITAVTKSGSNEFSGELFTYYQNKGLVSLNAWDEKQHLKKAAYERWQQGFSIGGPIIKDTVHFFLSYESQRQDTDKNVVLGWRKDTATVPASLLNTLRAKEGQFSSPFRSNLLFGKLDWQIDSAQQLEFTVNVRDESEKRGFGDQTAYERGEDMKVSVNSFTAKHKYNTGNWLNEAMVSFQNFRWNPKNITNGVGYEYADLMTIGGGAGGQDIKQGRTGFRDDFTYLGVTNHTIKAGANLDFLSYDVAKYFDTVPTYHYYYGDGSNDSTPNYSMPAWTILRVGNPRIKTDNKQFGWYIQDDWKVTPRLMLNLGVRWDYESDMFNNNYVTPADEWATVTTAIPSLSSNYRSDGSNRKPFFGAIQPRIGFSYNMTEDGKTVLFGGFGRYYDREAFNNSLDEKFRYQSRQYVFEWTANHAANPNRLQWDPALYGTPALLAQQAALGNARYEAFFLNNDQKPPHSDQFSLGLKHTTGAVNYQMTYTNVTSKDNLTWTWGNRDAAGNAINVPGIQNVLIGANSETWYQALYLTADRPYTENSGWGAGVSVTLSTTEKTGEGNFNPNGGYGAGLFSLPGGTINPFVRHKVAGTEQTRVVANGMVKLPWGFRLSTLITLGSGGLYDITDLSVYNDWGRPVIRYAEGHPVKYSFIIPNAWAYRSVDLRLNKDFTFGKSRLGLSFEGINVFNYANWNYDWDSGAIKPNGEVNPYFGQPHGGAYNPRRWQFGATYKF